MAQGVKGTGPHSKVKADKKFWTKKWKVPKGVTKFMKEGLELSLAPGSLELCMQIPTGQKAPKIEWIQPAKLSQQAYEDKKPKPQPQLTHQEQLHELFQGRDEHSTVINDLLIRIEKLETKVG